MNNTDFFLPLIFAWFKNDKNSLKGNKICMQYTEMYFEVCVLYSINHQSLNSSLQAALTSCSSPVMILLEDYLYGPAR